MAAALALVLPLGACTDLVPDPANESSTAPPSPEQSLSPEPFTSKDAERTRKLGETRDAKFVSFIDDQGSICLEVQATKWQTATTTCTSPLDFSQHGLSAELEASGNFLEAHLAPYGMVAESFPEGLERVSPTLVAGNARGVEGPVRFINDGNGRGARSMEMPRPISSAP